MSTFTSGSDNSDDDSDLTQPPTKSVFQILHDWETSSDSSCASNMIQNLLSPFCADLSENSSTEVLVPSTQESLSAESEASDILCAIPTE